ncbi:MAG TPA: HEAT repeat domain-containing protein [Candidatus Dormibacteraeota bacterium]|nr:HEAT repeat domain-containing protein [Candidatus Dormibacteraeota bacterium]
MKSHSLGLLNLVLLLCSFAVYAASEEEQNLIVTLRSDTASLHDKDAACAQLKKIGTDDCIPAVAALLANDQLSHSARYVLEPMKSPAAGKALVDALEKTQGHVQIGIIDSLGARRELSAVAALASLLGKNDEQAAIAAATALGQIGGIPSAEALEKNLKRSTGALHKAVVDASLRSATGLLGQGNADKAVPVFQHLYDSDAPEHIWIAAYSGLIKASGKNGLDLMNRALAGNEPASKSAALRLAPTIDFPAATKTLAGLLPKLEPLTEAALIEALQRRNDSDAAQAIAKAVASSSPEVRVAALNALGHLGDASNTAQLTEAAMSGTVEEQAAARLSLTQLHRGDVTGSLVQLLEKPSAAEAARALGERGDRAAVPQLINLAKAGQAPAKASLQALAALASDADLAGMTGLVLAASNPESRAQSAEALNAAYLRIQTRQGKSNTQPLADAVTNAPREARIALLPLCSNLNDDRVRAALRASLADKDGDIYDAAVRALCDSSDPQLLTDVLTVAKNESDKNRTIAIRAAVRLLTQEEAVKLTNAQKAEKFKAILSKPLTAEQKKLLLAGLAEVPGLASLHLVEPMLDQPEVQTEAAQAAVRLASGLAGKNSQAALPLLKKLSGSAPNDAIRKQAVDAMNKLQLEADYIAEWQVAGPYRQEGKDYRALFDIPFAPETTNASCDWKPCASEAGRPWVMDLLKTFGGNQCVAYGRTWIRCPDERTLKLELGTDDGVKAWLNGKVVYTNNVSRAIHPGSDKVNVTLHPGWNELLLKITQNTQGWAFCARFLMPDGAHAENLQFSSAPPK